MITEIPKGVDLESIRDKWISLGLIDGALDKEEVPKYLNLAYVRGGFPTGPETVHYVDSPIEAHKLILDLGWRVKGEFVPPACYGQHEADWAASIESHEAIGVTGLDVAGLMGLIANTHWIWMWEETAIVCSRPQIFRDIEHRLHAEDTAAVRYPDGYTQYYWHGVSVPDWVILEPARLTAEVILAETNQEVRRAMMEKATFAVLLDRAEELHRDEYGILYKLELAVEPEPIIFVLVQCPSTGKRYTLRVPPDTKTATEGVAWTFGLEANQYRPTLET